MFKEKIKNVKDDLASCLGNGEIANRLIDIIEEAHRSGPQEQKEKCSNCELSKIVENIKEIQTIQSEEIKKLNAKIDENLEKIVIDFNKIAKSITEEEKNKPVNEMIVETESKELEKPKRGPKPKNK